MLMDTVQSFLTRNITFSIFKFFVIPGNFEKLIFDKKIAHKASLKIKISFGMYAYSVYTKE